MQSPSISTTTTSNTFYGTRRRRFVAMTLNCAAGYRHHTSVCQCVCLSVLLPVLLPVLLAVSVLLAICPYCCTIVCPSVSLDVCPYCCLSVVSVSLSVLLSACSPACLPARRPLARAAVRQIAAPPFPPSLSLLPACRARAASHKERDGVWGSAGRQSRTPDLQ